MLLILLKVSVDHLSESSGELRRRIGKGSGTIEALGELDNLHPILHRLPHVLVVIVVLVGALGKLVGSDDELLARKLLFEFHKLVVANWCTYAFEHSLHRGVVGHREGAINLKFL